MSDPARGNSLLNLPPPSAPTTETVASAIGNLRGMLSAELKSIETRLDGIDRAAAIFNENLTRVATDTDKQICHLKELHAERFDSITQQLRGVVDGFKSTDEKIADIKGRLDRDEGALKGSTETRTSLVALVVAVVAVLGLGATYLTRVGAASPTPVYYLQQPQPLSGFAPASPQVVPVPPR